MPAHTEGRLPIRTLAALGVVFGDIGTNPLYAIRQFFQESPDLAHDPSAIVGIMSLIVWSLILVVCIKYMTFVLRADNEGEGGTLAMLGLIHRKEGHKSYALPGALTLIVLFGSALLYGDGMVTPAISVLSAIEGLEVATAAFKPWVVPLSVAILVALFVVQYRGTEAVGKLFGPVMIVWFATIAVMGVIGIARHPAIFAAFSPLPGLAFLVGHGWIGFASLGTVVLCFAGAEALFADLGHFGRLPITLGWYAIVLPSLVLNYLGQGALVMDNPAAAANPFYGMLPSWTVYPLVVISTAATVIASQALISGAFSLTQQAVNMGYAPRYRVLHTSETERGQIYMPVVNFFLMIGCVAIVLGFQSSDALGAAYGLAVIGTMTITSVVYFLVARRVWGWSLGRAVPLVVLFLVIDVAFLIANLAKIFSGAWVPLVIGLFVFAILAVWTEGRARFRAALLDWSMPLDTFRKRMGKWDDRSEGTAVFLTTDPERVPMVGRHEWLRRHVQHERVLLLSVESERFPHVVNAERLHIEDLGDGLYRGLARFGFMHDTDLGAILPEGLPFPWETTVFYFAQPIACPSSSTLSMLRERLFLFLGRTGQSPIEYFDLPAHQTVSVGLELQM